MWNLGVAVTLEWADDVVLMLWADEGAAYFKLGQALSTDIAVNQSMHSNKWGKALWKKNIRDGGGGGESVVQQVVVQAL